VDDILKIKNDGPKILSTNYWDSEFRKIIYLSWNAGAARLLLPADFENALPDMVNAPEIIISQGPSNALGVRDAFEILFEDHSKNPYCLHMSTSQSDRIPGTTLDGREDVPFTLYTRSGQVLDWMAKYRIVPEIPYLKPWGK